MQMTPAREWPCRAAKLVIVNLQPTVRDHLATIVIKAKIDDVMSLLIEELNKRSPSRPIVVPPYCRQETFIIKHQIILEKQINFVLDDGSGAPCGFILAIQVLNMPEPQIVIEKQPFSFDVPTGVDTVELRIIFDRVPLDGSFFTPPEKLITYHVNGQLGEQAFDVNLSQPRRSLQ
mmetsp:Transcript_6095/g.7885  ORF Transcript_6095/g.7885 Transcript_6095/m.7885 type:complete len:176 (-) Transcript_6095:223-750(-)